MHYKFHGAWLHRECTWLVGRMAGEPFFIS